jgi:hypothetical protein
MFRRKPDFAGKGLIWLTHLDEGSEIISNYFKGNLSFENIEQGVKFIINIPRYGGTCDGKA